MSNFKLEVLKKDIERDLDLSSSIGTYEERQVARETKEDIIIAIDKLIKTDLDKE